MVCTWFQFCSLVSTVETGQATCFWLCGQWWFKTLPEIRQWQSWWFIIGRWGVFCGTKKGPLELQLKASVSLMLACACFFLMHHILYSFSSLTWIHCVMGPFNGVTATYFFPEPFKSKLQRWFLFVSEYFSVYFLKVERVLYNCSVMIKIRKLTWMKYNYMLYKLQILFRFLFKQSLLRF